MGTPISIHFINALTTNIKIMKNYFESTSEQVFTFLVLCSLALLLVSCNEEDLGAPSISFETSRVSLNEGSQTLITLELKHPATQEYSLKIKVETNAIYGEHIVTE